MDIIIYINQKKIDRDYEAAMAEYQKRLMPFARVKLNKVKNYSKLELNKDTRLYAVCAGRETISSPMLSRLINKNNVEGCSRIVFVLFDSRDDAEEFLRKYSDAASDMLCLSSFTMSKGLTSVVLFEQLYRAYTILNNITYHK
jgi:23S rRNA (pseudouridine1915-N3)-methyltransferase